MKSPPLGLKLQRPVANSSTPREDAIIFSDLIGKVDMLRIESPQCDLPGQYRLADLIMRYDRSEKSFAFTDDVLANCARKQARRSACTDISLSTLRRPAISLGAGRAHQLPARK